MCFKKERDTKRAIWRKSRHFSCAFLLSYSSSSSSEQTCYTVGNSRIPLSVVPVRKSSDSARGTNYLTNCPAWQYLYWVSSWCLKFLQVEHFSPDIFVLFFCDSTVHLLVVQKFTSNHLTRLSLPDFILFKHYLRSLL